MKELWDKYKLKIVGVVVFIAIVAFSWNYFARDYVTKMIGTMIQNQVEIIMKNHKTDSKATEDKMNKLEKKIKKLEGNINENKPPKDYDELVNRFRKLGYSPITN